MEATVEQVLSLPTWAVVGWSPDPRRDSHRIAAFLEARGKRVARVNPNSDAALPGLAAAAPLEVVDVFRRSEAAGAHVDEAIALGARAVWLQLGVVDHDAFRRTTEAGVPMVMDTCPAMEWREP